MVVVAARMAMVEAMVLLMVEAMEVHMVEEAVVLPSEDHQAEIDMNHTVGMALLHLVVGTNMMMIALPRLEI